MRFYSVHAPPGEPDLKDRFRFIKDGFSWPALFVPVFWMLWHRLWLALVWYVVFVLLIAWAGRLGGDDLALPLAVIGTLFIATLMRGGPGALLPTQRECHAGAIGKD